MSSFGFQATGSLRHVQQTLLLVQECSLSSKWENKFIYLQYHQNSLGVDFIKVPLSYFDIFCCIYACNIMVQNTVYLFFQPLHFIHRIIIIKIPVIKN